MKKWIALLLALVMCLSLCACGGSSTSESSDKNEKQSDSAFDENGFGEEELAEPIILIDNGFLTVTATAKFKDPWEYSSSSDNFTMGYRVLVENKTTNKYFMLGVSNISVDGMMTDGFTNNIQVAPGKKAVEAIYVQKLTTDFVNTIDDLVDFEGTLTVFANEDGGLRGVGFGDAVEFAFP